MKKIYLDIAFGVCYGIAVSLNLTLEVRKVKTLYSAVRTENGKKIWTTPFMATKAEVLRFIAKHKYNNDGPEVEWIGFDVPKTVFKKMGKGHYDIEILDEFSTKEEGDRKLKMFREALGCDEEGWRNS